MLMNNCFARVATLTAIVTDNWQHVKPCRNFIDTLSLKWHLLVRMLRKRWKINSSHKKIIKLCTIGKLKKFYDTINFFPNIKWRNKPQLENSNNNDSRWHFSSRTWEEYESVATYCWLREPQLTPEMDVMIVLECHAARWSQKIT